MIDQEALSQGQLPEQPAVKTIEEANPEELAAFHKAKITENLAMLAAARAEFGKDYATAMNGLAYKLDRILDCHVNARSTLPGNANPVDAAMNIIAKMSAIASDILTNDFPKLVSEHGTMATMGMTCLQKSIEAQAAALVCAKVMQEDYQQRHAPAIDLKESLERALARLEVAESNIQELLPSLAISQDEPDTPVALSTEGTHGGPEGQTAPQSENQSPNQTPPEPVTTVAE